MFLAGVLTMKLTHIVTNDDQRNVVTTTMVVMVFVVASPLAGVAGDLEKKGSLLGLHAGCSPADAQVSAARH